MHDYPTLRVAKRFICEGMYLLSPVSGPIKTTLIRPWVRKVNVILVTKLSLWGVRLMIFWKSFDQLANIKIAVLCMNEMTFKFDTPHARCWPKTCSYSGVLSISVSNLANAQNLANLLIKSFRLLPMDAPTSIFHSKYETLNGVFCT